MRPLLLALWLAVVTGFSLGTPGSALGLGGSGLGLSGFGPLVFDAPFPLHGGDLAITLLGNVPNAGDRSDSGQQVWRAIVLRNDLLVGSIEAQRDVYGDPDSTLSRGVVWSDAGYLFIAADPLGLGSPTTGDAIRVAPDGTLVNPQDSIASDYGSPLAAYVRWDGNDRVYFLSRTSATDQMELRVHDDAGVYLGALTLDTRHFDDRFPRDTTFALDGASIGPDGVLYYTHAFNNGSQSTSPPNVAGRNADALIKRYDLVGDTQLTDLVSIPAATDGALSAVLALPDGTILATKLDFSGPGAHRLNRYDNTGAFLGDYAFQNPRIGGLTYWSPSALCLDYENPDYFYAGFSFGAAIAHVKIDDPLDITWIDLFDDWDDPDGYWQNSAPVGMSMRVQVPDSPPCTGVDFTAICGDILLGIGPSAGGGIGCLTVECWRAGARVGRVVRSANSYQGVSMAVDRNGNVYVPIWFGDDDGTVLKWGDGAKHYSGSGSIWFTAAADEHPIVVSFDRSNRAYVLVAGGDPSFSNATYLKLYRLNTAGAMLTTWTLDIPSGHVASGVGAGAAVTPNGSTYFYAFNEGSSGGIVAAWDLVNDVALPDLYDDPGFSLGYPQGVRVHPTGAVLLGYENQHVIQEYAATGSLIQDYPQPPYVNGGDVENDQDANHVIVSDALLGDVYRVTLSTGIVTKLFTALGGETYHPLAVLCAPATRRRSVGFTTVIG